MKYIVVSVFVILSASSHVAHAEEPVSIRDLLLVNSITNPRFGCLYYRDEKTAEYFLNGVDRSYGWSVYNDRYISGSNCGAAGCNIEKLGDQLTFSSVQTEYSITVNLHKGNYCNAGVISELNSVYFVNEFSQTQ